MNTPAGVNLRDRFIAGMSHAACTVNIVTTDGPAGRAGVTVSAMSSVSADTPRPTLLVCVHHQSETAGRILENGVFCVNVLRDDQGYISDTFAGRFKDRVTDKFSCAAWQAMASGAPRVIDPLVGFDCRVVSAERVGTHYVFLGEVGEVFTLGQGSPLIYANRAYGAATRIEPASPVGAMGRTGGGQLSIGCVDLFGPFLLPGLLGQLAESAPGVRVELTEGDQRRVVESLRAGVTELALLEDDDLGPGLDGIELTQLTPYVLLSEGHPLAVQDRIAPAELAQEPMILLDTQPQRDRALVLMRDAGIEPRIALRASGFEMVRGLVGHGLGYALMTARPAAAMSYDGCALVCRPLSPAPTTARLILAWRDGAALSPAARRFVQLCRAFFELDT